MNNQQSDQNSELNRLGELNNQQFAELSKQWKELKPEQIQESVQGNTSDSFVYNGDVIWWVQDAYQKISEANKD